MDAEIALELLAALKQMVVDYGDVPDPTDSDGQAVIQRARAAIVKAEARPFALCLSEPPQPRDWPADYWTQFWSAYPRRTAPAAAKKALEKVRKKGDVPFSVILDAVKIFRHETQNTEMQFIPHPATWINDGRWADDRQAIAGRKGAEVKNGFMGRLMEP
jgi:hypothetical protein